MSRVLVVDDDKEMRGDLKILLERRGYEVVVYDSGPPVIDAVRGGLPYDIGLIDQILPGMHGNEVIKELKKLNPGAPLIAMSSFSPASPNADGFISKTESIGKFYRILEEHLFEN